MSTRKHPPEQGDNVVELPRRPDGTLAIVAEVREKSSVQKQEISARLQELLQITHERHLARAQELVPIGMQLTRPDLDDLIEIGQRMLQVRGRT